MEIFEPMLTVILSILNWIYVFIKSVISTVVNVMGCFGEVVIDIVEAVLEMIGDFV